MFFVFLMRFIGSNHIQTFIPARYRDKMYNLLYELLFIFSHDYNTNHRILIIYIYLQ